jgi:hypothetical protein
MNNDLKLSLLKQVSDKKAKFEEEEAKSKQSKDPTSEIDNSI